MKKLFPSLFLLLAIGCAKQNLTPAGQPMMRDLVNSDSSARAMKNESKDISNAISDVADAQQKISDLCDGLSEQISAFNDALASKQGDLAKLIDEKNDLIAMLNGAKADFDDDWKQEKALQGLIDGAQKKINALGKPSTFKSQLAAEKRNLLKQRRDEKRLERGALKRLARADFPSDDYDKAEQDLRDARGELNRIDGQLKELAPTVSANINAEIQAEQAKIPGYQHDFGVAQMARITAYSFFVTFKAQLKAKQQQIRQLPRLEDLMPYTVPAPCESN